MNDRKMEVTFLKSWIFIFTAFRYFVSGVEESIILPTIWFYVRSLGGTKIFLGITISVYSITALLFSPVFGALSDKFRRPKVILIICHVTRLFGNALYSIPVSKYCPLFGRFLCGVSAASDGVLIGEVVRITKETERAKAFLILEGIYTLGSSFGPVLAGVSTFNLDIFGWQINEGNSPGFVITIIWIMIVILTFFLPNDVKKEDFHEDDDNEPTNDDNAMLKNKTPDKYSSLKYYSTILCLFYLIFLTWFFTSAVSFYTPLLAMEIFHLEQIHVKLLFTNGALCLMAVYLTIYIVEVYFEERCLLLITVCLQIIPILVLFVFASFWNSGQIHKLCYLLIVYICFGMSYSSFTLASSLLSKITNPDHISFYQGLSLAIDHIGSIAGRIISSFIFTQATMIPFSLGLSFLWMLGVSWLCFVYQYFRPN